MRRLPPFHLIPDGMDNTKEDNTVDNTKVDNTVGKPAVG